MVLFCGLTLRYHKTAHPVVKPTPKQTISKKYESAILKYKLDFPVSENWDNPVEEYESRNRFEITNKINEYISRERT